MKNKTIKRKWGWKPDIPDQRDYPFSKFMKVIRRLPVSVDLRNNCSPIEDQGSLGSCTACASAGLVEFLSLRNGIPFDASKLFIYYNARALEGTVDSDSGAYLRDNIKTLVSQGVCMESLWPYTISKFMDKPTNSCYLEALNHQALGYYRISSLIEMKSCLASGLPFMFGFAVYESFLSDVVELTGKVPMPLHKERMLGGHAVVDVGYRESDKRFIVRNSWGSNWGIDGYFTMPYAYLDSKKLSGDFWTITKQE